MISLIAVLVSQFSGNSHRSFTDGLLAWLFMPIGLISCLTAWPSEGWLGIRNAFIEYTNTLFNREDSTGNHPAHF
ncbi:MAG: hypothetical protein JNL57_07635 [Bacteroidetes bacterium]|nr:hypothetical protein [Bacteroidota bacterium]